MNLSNQALNVLMMALQKSLMEQSDIVPVLRNFDFVDTKDGLWVKNPPIIRTMQAIPIEEVVGAETAVEQPEE